MCLSVFAEGLDLNGRVLTENNSFWNLNFIKQNIFFELICKKVFQVFQTLPTYNLIHYLPYNYILYLIHFIERKVIYRIKMKTTQVYKNGRVCFLNPSKVFQVFHFPSHVIYNIFLLCDIKYNKKICKMHSIRYRLSI